MAGNCNDINPLQLSGTSQAQRALPALDPASAPADGRQAADWILFAREYGRYLQFYNALNIPDGNWQGLMQKDISVVLATLVAQQMPLYQDYQRGLYTQILGLPDDAAHTSQGRQFIEGVFDLLFSWIYLLDQQYQSLSPGSDPQASLGGLIQGDLSVAADCLKQYYSLISAAGLVEPVTSATPIDVLPPVTLTLSPAPYLLAMPLSPVWTVAAPILVPPIPTTGSPDTLSQIRTLVTSNLFNSIINTILGGIGTLSTYAGTALAGTLSDYPSHTPHYALYLAFLQLFQQAIDHLNGFTGAHLAFYYQDALQLEPQAAAGDQVHLVVTLQRNVPYLPLPKGTVVQAGKDAGGKALYYATAADYTVNQGLVTALSSIRYVSGTDSTYGPYATVYESPVANSDDGDGAALTSPDKSWYPFGNLQTIKETASLGFAIASRDLYLREGQRTVTVTFALKGKLSLPGNILQTAFGIQVTGAKGWIVIPASNISVKTAANSVQYTFSLDGKSPAVLGYSPGLHEGSFSTTLPMVQFLLQMEAGTFNPLYAFNQAGLTGITIGTSMQGGKQMTVSTDTGPVDPSKPFMPFGASPHLGSAITIGYKEAFSKNLSNLTLLVEWDKLPATLVTADGQTIANPGLDIYEDTNYPYTDSTGTLRHRVHQADISFLQEGIWQEDDGDPRGLFTGDELFTSHLYPSTWIRNAQKYAQAPAATGSMAWQNAYDAISFPLGAYSPSIFDDMTDDGYSTGSTEGFTRLTLAGADFGHDDYLNAILNVTITSTPNSNGSTTTTIARVQPPYTPVIKSMQLCYTSSAGQDFADGGGAQFFYLYPFGYQQASPPATLLPAYTHQGELYIGLSGLTGLQNLSLLIQISEGSANPLESPPAVTWSYLSSGNDWVDLDPATEVQDATNGLLQSGLVILTLPADLGISAPLMGGGNSWVRASVGADADAICHIITIQAQGILAVFTDYTNTGITYTAPVSAGTISKWVKGNPSVKSLSQPYDSFGGRPAETAAGFSLRVSERLRHKARAINIWDYEHLVLQQFPQLYKAKCLNHTSYTAATDTQPMRFAEALPGHVTVVTLPNIENQHSVDPFTPYTSLGLLSDIQDYLSTVVSPFVQLHMANPQFEGVQFEVCVRFQEGADPTASGNQLSQDIARFLSPWAFQTSQDIDFGGSLAKSVVLKFIEDLSYVDYVTCIQMNQYISGTTILYDLDVATASTSLSILVSYRDPLSGTGHLITPLLTDTNTCDCT